MCLCVNECMQCEFRDQRINALYIRLWGAHLHVIYDRDFFVSVVDRSTKSIRHYVYFVAVVVVVVVVDFATVGLFIFLLITLFMFLFRLLHKNIPNSVKCIAQGYAMRCTRHTYTHWPFLLTSFDSRDERRQPRRVTVNKAMLPRGS